MGTLADLIKIGQASLGPGPAGPMSLRARLASGELTSGPALSPGEPRVSPEETVAGSWLDSMPLGKTIGAAAATLGLQAVRGGTPARLTDKAKAEMQERGIPLPDEEGGVLDDYRTLRDAGRARIAAGERQNPKAKYLGKGLAFANSFALPAAQVARGAGVVGRLLPAALTAAGYGAVGSVENGAADVSRGEFGQAFKDASGYTGLQRAKQSFAQGEKLRGALELAGAGAPGGFATGLLVGGATEAVRRPLSGALKSLGIRKTKDVIQGGSDIAAPGRQPLSDDAAEAVLEQKLLGANTAETYAKIDNRASSVGDRYGRILAELEARGVRGPDAKALADKLMDEYATLYQNTGANKAAPNVLRDEAANVLDVGRKLPLPGAEGPELPTLALSQSEAIKRDLATRARLDRLTNSATEDAHHAASSVYRQGTEDAVAAAGAAAGPDSEIAALADRFVPTKRELGTLLEARTAAERGAVKAAARSSGPNIIDAMIGSAAGDPASAYIAAMASRSLRSRLPSMVARGSYGMSKAVQSGGASRALARALELAKEREEDTRALPRALGISRQN